MTFLRALRQLWRHHAFRRLALVRVFTQAGDATLQLGMASYILFSPQRQPTALAIALMFTVTLLPFSVVGPFVGVLLDRIPRRLLILIVDTVRALVCLTVAALVAARPTTAPTTLALFFILLLVAMSLNRFLLAGLSAALPTTVDADELLAANSVMPVVAPLGALMAGLGLGARLGLTALGWSATAADAVVFLLAACFFVASVAAASGFSRRQLGPSHDAPRTSARDVVAGMAAALDHCRERSAAGVSLTMLGLQRVGHGLAQVATLLVFRNLVDAGDEVRALADIGAWAGLTGVGFLLATVLAPALFTRLGLRRGLVVVLSVSAALQWWPGAWFLRWPLVVSGVLLGVCAQMLKIGVDTLVQAHVDDAVKGRVFTLYDIVFNMANVVAAWIAVAVVPTTGDALTVFGAVCASYILLAIWFARRARQIDDFEAGADSLR